MEIPIPQIFDRDYIILWPSLKTKYLSPEYHQRSKERRDREFTIVDKIKPDFPHTTLAGE
jgi:hypothetical protein